MGRTKDEIWTECDLQKLVDFTLGLVEGTPNSAGLERIFSTTGLTRGSLRSRIGVENEKNWLFCTEN